MISFFGWGGGIADFASRTEQAMQADKTNDPKQIQTLSTNRRVREKEEEEEAPKQQTQDQNEEFQDGFTKSRLLNSKHRLS